MESGVNLTVEESDVPAQQASIEHEVLKGRDTVCNASRNVLALSQTGIMDSEETNRPPPIIFRRNVRPSQAHQRVSQYISHFEIQNRTQINGNVQHLPSDSAAETHDIALQPAEQVLEEDLIWILLVSEGLL